MASFFRWYRSLIDKYPIRTPCVSAAILQACGDCIAQSFERSTNKDQKYDLKRTVIMSSLGFCFFGPVGSTTMRFYHVYKVKPYYAIAMDQMITSPLFVSGFTILHPLLHGEKLQTIADRFWGRYSKLQLKAWSSIVLSNYQLVLECILELPRYESIKRKTFNALMNLYAAKYFLLYLLCMCDILSTRSSLKISILNIYFAAYR